MSEDATVEQVADGYIRIPVWKLDALNEQITELEHELGSRRGKESPEDAGRRAGIATAYIFCALPVGALGIAVAKLLSLLVGVLW